ISTIQGDVNFVDAASYRTPSLQLLPTKASDIVNSDITLFCPLWARHSSTRAEEGRVERSGGRTSWIDNLLGIYALTTEGQHVFRTFTGPEHKTVTTRVIASDIIGQSCLISSNGATIVAAFGERAIHLCGHYFDDNIEEEMYAPDLLTTIEPISQCHVRADHMFVWAGEQIALLSLLQVIHNGETRGVAVRHIELQEGEEMSAYGGFEVRGETESLVCLSIVGTSHGRIYRILLEDGALEETKYDDVQALLSSPTTLEYYYDEAMSKAFLESGERVVSASARPTEETAEITVLGEKGTLLRCSYSAEEGVKLLEEIFPDPAMSNLVYRNLVTVACEEGEECGPPLIVAVKADGKDARSSELVLLDSVTEGELFAVKIESSAETSKIGCSDTVWVHRSPGGGAEAVGLLTLHTARAGRKRANIDAIACFEGTLKRTEETQLVRKPELAHHVGTLYPTLAVDRAKTLSLHRRAGFHRVLLLQMKPVTMSQHG
ncbi:hypothetical protein PFISCL1PPCAC_21183, partial [Pristionchus fissidentatus]